MEFGLNHCRYCCAIGRFDKKLCLGCKMGDGTVNHSFLPLPVLERRSVTDV